MVAKPVALWHSNAAARVFGPVCRLTLLGCGCSSGVEHNLAKVGVEGSNPFARSKISKEMPGIGATRQDRTHMGQRRHANPAACGRERRVQLAHIDNPDTPFTYGEYQHDTVFSGRMILTYSRAIRGLTPTIVASLLSIARNREFAFVRAVDAVCTSVARFSCHLRSIDPEAVRLTNTLRFRMCSG